MTEKQNADITWIDSGREPKCEPDPAFPHGVIADLAGGHHTTCMFDLPYPAKRCGMYRIVCGKCGFRVGVTTAGRPDDPVAVILPCYGQVMKPTPEGMTRVNINPKKIPAPAP